MTRGYWVRGQDAEMLYFAERGISTMRHGEREPSASGEDVLHLPHAASRRHPQGRVQRHKEVGGLLSFMVTRSTFVSPHHLHLSHSPVDRWGATDDLATSSLHSSRLSAFLVAAPSHSGMLSSHHVCVAFLETEQRVY